MSKHEWQETTDRAFPEYDLEMAIVLEERMTLMRFGNFALLVLDLHLLVASLFFLSPPMQQWAAAGLSALILFSLAVIAFTSRK